MKSGELNRVYVSCPLGLQYVLEKELVDIGVSVEKAVPGGVYVIADLKALYRILIWSRIANRVVLQLWEGAIADDAALYKAATEIDWNEHFTVSQSFSVHFSGTCSFIRNSTYGALKIKDAIVDTFRTIDGLRPSVSRDNPDMRIVGVLNKGRLTIGLDLSGKSLHQRGYRKEAGQAPLKENLAAGILMQLNWPEGFPQDATLIDPMCGSGTFVIEAMLMSNQIAPGILKEQWPVGRWKQHDAAIFDSVVENAREIAIKGQKNCRHRFYGFDQDKTVIAKAWENLKATGLGDHVHFEKAPLAELDIPAQANPGLLVVNPPYGERLGEVKQLKSLYQQLGEKLDECLNGWRVGVFTANQELGKSLGWRSYKQYKLFNGALESQLICVDVKPENRFREAWKPLTERLAEPGYWKISHNDRAEMFANRLNKNIKSLGKWARKNSVSCYRVYDADMPEFSLAIDQYETLDQKVWWHVQEYMAPKGIDPKQALERLREALAVIRDMGIVDVSRIVLKQREIKKGKSQYEKKEDKALFLPVMENGYQLQVNLINYLDTGLFLDHRPIRRWIQEHSGNKRFLNLFCYTAAVTVAAISGGARESLSLDMSKTYLNWAGKNFDSNGFQGSDHQLQQVDCLEWLTSASKQLREKPYDLIFMDPPSFSNSKRMQGVLDVQRDHAEMIDQAMRLLAIDGTLIFSTNLRKFKLDPVLQQKWKVSDFTSRSLDPDFSRNRRIHQCWMIKKR